MVRILAKTMLNGGVGPAGRAGNGGRRRSSSVAWHKASRDRPQSVMHRKSAHSNTLPHAIQGVLRASFDAMKGSKEGASAA
jgi:hypothetical protein